MMGDNISPGASASAARASTADGLFGAGPANLSTSLAPVVSSLGSSLGTVTTDVPVMANSASPFATANSGDNWTYGSRYATGYDGTIYMVGPNLPPAAYKPMDGGGATGSSSQPQSSASSGTAAGANGAAAGSSGAGTGSTGAVTGSTGAVTGDANSIVNMLLQLLTELLTLLLQQMTSSNNGQQPATPQDPDPDTPVHDHETHGHSNGHHRDADGDAAGARA